MQFKIVEDEKEISCQIVKIFNDESNKLNYIIYTDGTKNEDGEYEVYASRYFLENSHYMLHSIENEYEWNLIDNILLSERGN